MAEDYCDIHKVQMKRIEGKYGVFYSHETNDEKYPKAGAKNLRYCNGKPPKEEKQNGTKDDSPRIRLKLYELGLNYAPGDIPNWLRMAEDYVFNGKIPTKNVFPQEESQDFPQEE